LAKRLEWEESCYTFALGEKNTKSGLLGVCSKRGRRPSEADIVFISPIVSVTAIPLRLAGGWQPRRVLALFIFSEGEERAWELVLAVEDCCLCRHQRVFQ
jgi:hypothetical protein